MKPQDRIWGAAPYPNIVDVGAGEDSSYALTEEGRIFAWGSNDWGQLGISDLQEEPLQRPDGALQSTLAARCRACPRVRSGALVVSRFACMPRWNARAA